MQLLYRFHIGATERRHRITAAISKRLSQLDRGDSPVPTAVIIVGLVLVAGIVITALGTMVRGYLEDAPDNVPQP